MSRRTRLVLLSAATLVTVFIGGSLLCPSGIACGSCPMRVTGRLVDARTEAPLVDAEVITLPRAEWADQVETIRVQRLWAWGVDAERKRLVRTGGAPLPPREAAQLCAVGRTDATGAFDLMVSVGVSSTLWCGFWIGARYPPTRSGVRALRIETAEGAPAIVVPVPSGEWEDSQRQDGLWATWRLGEIRVTISP